MKSLTTFDFKCYSHFAAAHGVKSIDLDKFINAGIYYVDIRDAKDSLLTRKKILIE